MEEDLAQLEVLERSFVNFVYPFRFDSDEYVPIVKHFQDSWECKELRGISDYLLSPVANYLGINNNSTAIFFNPTCEFKKEINLDEEKVWTIKVKDNNIQFKFDSRTKTGKNGLNVPAVELALFKIGVGFLILRTHSAISKTRIRFKKVFNTYEKILEMDFAFLQCLCWR